MFNWGQVRSFNPSTQETEAGGSLSQRPTWSTQKDSVSKNKNNKAKTNKKTHNKKCDWEKQKLKLEVKMRAEQ